MTMFLKPDSLGGLVPSYAGDEFCTEPTRGPTRKELLANLNETHCVVRFGGKTRIFAWEESETGTPVPAFYTVEALTAYYSDQKIMVKQGKTTKETPVFRYWLDHSAPRAQGLALDAGGERFVGKRLNLWSGFGFQPEAGKWPLLRQHIEDVVCDGDEAAAAYVLNWLAWVLQNPTKTAEVALVLRGKKGSGKGTLGRLLCDIFAAHGLQIASRKHLVGNFNAHLLHCCLLFADEALWPGDKEGEGSLKRMVTEPTLTVEPKGIDAYEAPNRLSIIMASNEDWVVPASEDERRFACFDVSGKRIADANYFEALRAEIYDQGGAEAFLADMLAVTKPRHPRYGIPENKALASQKLETASPEVHWLWRVLEEGRIPGSMCGEPHEVKSSELFDHTRGSDHRLRYWTEPKFRAFLEAHGAEKKHKRTGNHFIFPPLIEARKRFKALHPAFPEFTAVSAEDGEIRWRHEFNEPMQ